MTELGINTCFAVKRWPRPQDWAPIVRDELGLDLVQVSLDLIDVTRDDDSLARDVDEHLEAAARHGIRLHSVFTGLAGYSSNLLLHPSERERDAAERWYERAHRLLGSPGRGVDGRPRGGLQRPRLGRPRAPSGAVGGAQGSAGTAGQGCAQSRARGSPRRESRSPARAIDHGRHRVPRHGRRRGARPHPIVPGRGAHVRAGHDGRGARPVRLASQDEWVRLGHPDPAGRHGRGPPLAVHGALRAMWAGSIPTSVLEALGPDITAPLVFEVIPAFEAPDADVLRDLVESVRCWGEAIARSEYPLP